MRKLATIECIRSVKPIPNADNLDVVQVRGWDVVTQRQEFQEGDLAVYFEIDSFLPIRPEFEFLRKSSFKVMGAEEGFRLRTVKLRGQISQGLVLPVKNIPELADRDWTVGDDVTELLGVQRYEPPIPVALAGQIKGAFPGLIRKTDQERIQNLWEDYHQAFQDLEFEETVKLDGTSMTVYCHAGNVGVCSRNWELQQTAGNTLWQVATQLELLDRLPPLQRNLAVQGELMGPGIQGNKEKLAKVAWFVFDIWDLDRQQYLGAAERNDLVATLGLQQVPVVTPAIPVFSAFPTLEALLDHAAGPSLHAAQREGLVYKSLQAVEGEIISFKVISNQWLLKHEE
jgi:RNA ligase (TIGR02306 family)